MNAFPLPMGTDTVSGTEGMTLRDYFAGQAIVGLSALSAHPQSPSIDGQAKMAYEIADAMIKARNV